MRKRLFRSQKSFVEIEKCSGPIVSPASLNYYVCYIKDCYVDSHGNYYCRDFICFEFASETELSEFYDAQINLYSSFGWK